MESLRKEFLINSVCVFFLCSVTANELFSESIESSISTVPTKEEHDAAFKGPYIKNNFFEFKEALAHKESRGQYDIVNKFGYMGKYQFGKTTLKYLKINDEKTFLETPLLQEKAFVALCQVNKWILRKEITSSVGKTFNGIHITESGILAAAHLAGAGNVMKYLKTKGKYKFSDAFGTSMEYYMKKFGGYDTSTIVQCKTPTINKIKYVA
ncbi:MAG: peptidoglycan-binding protein LysM [Flavicella sp.]